MQRMFKQAVDDAPLLRTSGLLGDRQPVVQAGLKEGDSFKLTLLTPRPGMLIGLYSGNGRDALQLDLLNDRRYVHFSCLLGGEM